MSTIDLIILGILFEKPMNAYELTHFIEDRGISRFLKISKQAIYKSCKRLHSSNHIDGKKVQEGNAPEKTVYTINEKGTQYFYELMEHYATAMTPMYFEFNTFLWNINKMEYSKALSLLEKMEQEFNTLLTWVSSHEQEVKTSMPFGSRMIVKKYRMLCAVFVQWIAEVIEDYKKEFE